MGPKSMVGPTWAKPDRRSDPTIATKFLGHDIDAKGIHANHDKIEAIIKMSEPRSAAELSTFLGMAGYYRKFLNNFAEIADLLYKIVNKEKWAWNEHYRSFNDLKKLISLPPLTYFNPELPIGLFHTEKDGKEKPIAFASRTLIRNELTNIEREALAIMFAIKRFQEYLIGTKFKIITDHKPLVHIFTKGLKDNSTMIVSRD
ncbi:unnamed protein product [Gordionus sp. m RMFG-2023]